MGLNCSSTVSPDSQLAREVDTAKAIRNLIDMAATPSAEDGTCPTAADREPKLIHAWHRRPSTEGLDGSTLAVPVTPSAEDGTCPTA
jgi:hypothetical protein